jgi:polysaccharide biosynthesis transport protein
MSMRTPTDHFTDSAVFLDDRRGPVQYLHALRARWPLILLLVALAVGAAAAYSITAPKRYEASADILVTPISTGDETFVGFSMFREGIEAAQSVVTAARVVLSPEVVERVEDDLEVENPERLVEVKPLGQSSVVTIKATASSADEAADVANAFAEAVIEIRSDIFQEELDDRIEQLTERLRSIPAAQRERDFESIALQQRLAELNSLVGAPDPTLRVLSEAVPPEVASWPRPVLSVAVALLAALLLGAALAVALEVLDPRLNREEDLTAAHRLPILARIPKLPRKLLARPATPQPLPPQALKAYRLLRANLALAGEDDRPPKSVLVTSAQPGDGKSLTSVNLARTMAAAGLRVVLIDWDLHRPRVALLTGVWGRASGVARALRDPAHAPAALAPAPGYGGRLQLLLSSPDHAYLARRLNTDRVQAVIDSLGKVCDVIVMDSPPILEVAEAVAIAEAADATVIAVRMGHTRRDRLVELRRVLAMRRIEPVGFVVTLKRAARESNAYYYDAVDGEPDDGAEPEAAAPRGRRATGAVSRKR